MATIDKVSLDIQVVLGCTDMPVHQVLRLGRGAIIELDATEDDEVRIPTLYIDESTGDRQVARLRELRQTRDNDAVRQSLEVLKETARGTGNTMEPLMDCVRAYATVGEMCDALREVWGEYEEVPLI